MTAIVQSDILFRLSAPNASSGNTQLNVPGNLWGGYVSSTVLSGTNLNSIFPDITGAENAAQQVDYACIFVHNNTASGNSMVSALGWIPTSGVTPGGASIQAALDPTGATILTSNTQQAVKITSPYIAPAGVTGWISPVSSIPTGPSFTNGLQMGTIAPGFVYPIWFKRTAPNSAALNNDMITLNITFSTAG